MRLVSPMKLACGFLIACWTLAGACPASLLADDSAEKKPASEAKDQASDAKESVAEPTVVQRELELNGELISYEVTTGKLPLKDDAGKKLADVFFIAYTKQDSDHKQRPVTFAFNGGPGSSSVWLHLGMLGPRRIPFRDDAKPTPPPYDSVDNAYSLLDTSDLVFIDPVSTGYSRPAEGQDKGEFHGYDEDLRSVGQFIHDYTSKYQRWLSPKFLLGESYGGIRAAGLSGYLQDRYNMELNGLVIISGVINFQTLRFGPGNDLAYICFLPSYAATAWYHGQLDEARQAKPVSAIVAEAERFAAGPYAAALLKGDSLPDSRVEAIAKQMSQLTGLSPSYIQQSRLRVSQGRFSKELLRDKDLTAGRFDSRYTGIDRDSAGEGFEYDASGSAWFGAYTAVINDYLRRDLNYSDDRVYEVLTGNVQPWSYRRFEGRYVDATETLRKAMTTNPFLKVYFACGYYDLATPHFGMEYTADHLGLTRELRDNLRFGYYEGGHMMYVHEPSLAKLKKELVKFYESATQPATND